MITLELIVTWRGPNLTISLGTEYLTSVIVTWPSAAEPGDQEDSSPASGARTGWSQTPPLSEAPTPWGRPGTRQGSRSGTCSGGRVIKPTTSLYWTHLTKYWQPAARVLRFSGDGERLSLEQAAELQAERAEAATSSDVICSEERQSTERTTLTSAASQPSLTEERRGH